MPYYPHQGPTPRWMKVTFAVVAVVLVVGAVLLAVHARRRSEARAGARKAADGLASRQALATQQLQAMVTLEPCLQGVEWGEPEQAASRAAAGPVAGAPAATSSLAPCEPSLDALLRDPSSLTPASVAPLQGLRHADLAIADGRHDPAAFAAAVAARHAAIRAVRTVVLPQLRDQVTARWRRYEAAHGRDALWWQIDVRLGLWWLMDAALVASHLEDGGPVDLGAASTAARPLWTALQAEVARAPAAIRDEVAALAYFTKAIADGAPLDVFAIVRFVENDLGLTGTMVAALGAA